MYFPDGKEAIPKERLSAMWDARYARFPRLRKIGVIGEYYFLKSYLMSANVKKDSIHIADSHKSIREIIEAIPKSLPIRIVNIDFHHDYYHYYTDGEYYNCGNWLRRVIEERPETQVKWIRRKDSQTLSLEGEFPFEHTTDIQSVTGEKFDYIFLCRSPEWSPPHLSGKFKELIWFFSHDIPA